MEDTVHENHTRSISYETSVLVGQVTGLQDSLVTCAVQNGVLQGIISSKGEETLYILPTTWVLKSPSIFWSVIYTEHDFKRDSLLHQFIRNHHKSYISLQNKIRAVNEIHYMIRDHLKVLNDIFEEAMFTVNKGTAGEFTFSGFQFEKAQTLHDNNETACGEYSVLNEPDAGYYLMHEVAVTGDLENNFKL
ncbi:hypothetical protein MAR_018895 [Mya arenaria]|uniref:Uncharacterized protein n=1 Tax=Mya arenaria TaxID=6604 RepID=A0ABY7EJ31_MYAAR|nr:hypothetical protein MAR_018895 [Mya arenaria]